MQRKTLANAEVEIDGEMDDAAVNSQLTDHLMKHAIKVNDGAAIRRGSRRQILVTLLLYALAAPVFLAAIAISLLSARGERLGKPSLWDRLKLPSAAAGRDVRADGTSD